MTLLQTITRVRQAFVDQRRSFRHNTRCRAWIEFDDHTPPRACTVVDISDSGARIKVATPGDLPDEFSLVLLDDAANVRRGRIIWRSHDEIGVNYLEPHAR